MQCVIIRKCVRTFQGLQEGKESLKSEMVDSKLHLMQDKYVKK